MAVAITGVPDDRPTNLSLKRGSENTMDLKWTVPLNLRDENNPRRMTWQDLTYVFQASKNMDSKYQEVRSGAEHITADRLWIRDVGPNEHAENATRHSQTYDRTKYHPLTLDRYLTSVTASVFIGNTVSRFSHPIESSLKSTISYAFELPKTPELGDPTFDTTSLKAACSLSAAADDGKNECYDTMWCITRQDNFTSTYKSETVIKAWESTRDSSVTMETLAISDATTLSESQWIKITFKAYSRGLRGNSATVSKTYVVANPARPSITSVTISSLTASNGVVTIRMNPNKGTYRPIDSFSLQRLTNTTINTIALARESLSWEDVANAVSDGSCTGFTDSVSAARPDRNKHVWYRIKSVRGTLTQYSDPVKVTALERNATPITDDVVTVDTVASGDDGESLKVIFGWSDDDSNGTEISWSEKADAWVSTTQPSVYNVPDTWKDDASQVSGKDNSAMLIIRGLTEGVPYYIKARRYHDTGNDVEYANTYASAPDAQYPIAPVTKPSSVTLKVPAYVKRGSDLEVSWTYEGISDQKRWNLYRHEGSGSSVSKVLIASGDDSVGSTVVSGELLTTLGDTITLSVSITTGGDWEESPTVDVTVADPPYLIAVTDSKLLSQPAQFYIGCDRANAILVTKVYSNGTFSGTPNGTLEQVSGDTLWSDKSIPAWYENEDGLYYSIVTLPEGLDFRNTVEYVMNVSVIDPQTGFSSNVVEMTFEVDWAHTARQPGATTNIKVSPDNKSVRISPAKPENWVYGDVYDLYRVTTDTIDKIAEGQEYGTDAVDRYAPFGKNTTLRYRIANRTKDGDVQWKDFPYNLKGAMLRFDWAANRYIELPYNITMDDAYTKNYEAHTHLDGSKSGHWNPGFNKTGSFSTKLIRLEDRDQARIIREMGTYPGPVFVRTPDGSAYQANVVVKGLSDSYDNLLLGIDISVEALSLSDEYRLSHNDFVIVDVEPEPEEPTYERSQILYWGTEVPVTSDTYILNELPVGDVFKVELSTSYDNYLEPWTVPATYDGYRVTLGTFGQELEDYLIETQTDPSTQYLVKAYYNISQGSEETSEDTSEDTSE